MRESLTIYDPEVRGIQLVGTEPFLGKKGIPGVDRDPNHLRNTYNMEDELYRVVMEIDREFRRIAPEVVEYKAMGTEDAELVVVAHGIVSRATEGAVRVLREKGYRVGHFRPITLRPFPGDALKQAVAKAKRVMVVESAMGQLAGMLKEELYDLSVPVISYFRPGEGITVEEVVEQVIGK